MALVRPVEFISKKGKSILIRNAQITEAEKIREALAVMAETSPYILSSPEDHRKRPVRDQEIWIDRINQSGSSFFLIALDGNRIVATCDFSSYKDSKRRHRGGLGISVHHEYRGEGIGKKMMEMLIERASQFSNILFIELNVMEPNQIAIEMYKKLGFKVINTLPQAYQLSDGKFIANMMMWLEVKR